MANPKISIITTTYNRPVLLQRAIDSVLCQTFTDFELLIIDDHSDSPPIFKLPDGEDRIIGIRMPYNTKRDAKGKNVGIMAARSKIICYLDDDNVYLPNHLEVLYEAIKDNKADVVYGDRIYKSTIPNEKRFMGRMSYDFDLKRIEKGNYIDTSDIMHTIQSINEVGFFNINCEKMLDWLLMKKFGKAGMRIVHVPQILTEYHWHDDPQGNIGTPLI